MKIIAISDTHNLHHKLVLPEGDMIIHAGDFTTWGDIKEANCFKNWFAKLPYKYKVCIAGNHDRCMESMHFLAKDFEQAGIIYLRNSSVNVEGINIYGSPYTPEYGAFSFMYNRSHGTRQWQWVPDDTEILITHGPPYQILDECQDGMFDAGCEQLLERTKQLKKLKYHIFGHVHEGYGIQGKHVNASNHPGLWDGYGNNPVFNKEHKFKPIELEI